MYGGRGEARGEAREKLWRKFDIGPFIIMEP